MKKHPLGFAGGKEWGWGVGRRPWREQFPEKTGGEGEEERQGLGYHGFAVTRNTELGWEEVLWLSQEGIPELHTPSPTAPFSSARVPVISVRITCDSIHSPGGHHPELERMKASMVLSLIGYLVVPSGAAVLGCWVVAKKLHEGGLSDFEGYSLENCK